MRLFYANFVAGAEECSFLSETFEIQLSNGYSRSCSGIHKNIFSRGFSPEKNNCVSHCSKLTTLLTPQDKFDMFLVTFTSFI